MFGYNYGGTGIASSGGASGGKEVWGPGAFGAVKITNPQQHEAGKKWPFFGEKHNYNNKQVKALATQGRADAQNVLDQYKGDGEDFFKTLQMLRQQVPHETAGMETMLSALAGAGPGEEAMWNTGAGQMAQQLYTQPQPGLTFMNPGAYNAGGVTAGLSPEVQQAGNVQQMLSILNNPQMMAQLMGPQAAADPDPTPQTPPPQNPPSSMQPGIDPMRQQYNAWRAADDDNDDDYDEWLDDRHKYERKARRKNRPGAFTATHKVTV